MSSLRNAVKRITHKERSQPRHRKHLGLLEKKEDYKKRAEDVHRKEEGIRTMQVRASMRNPDEFYFGMHNSQVKSSIFGDGQHRKTVQALQKEFEEKIGGGETIRLMKDQDLSYVRMQILKDQKRIERLQANLHHLDTKDDSQEENINHGRTHTVFVDSAEEAHNFDAAKHFDTMPELVGRAYNRPRIEMLKRQAQEAMSIGARINPSAGTSNGNNKRKQQCDSKMTRKLARVVARERASAYREMEEREDRVAKLKQVEAAMVVEKLHKSKGRKRMIQAAENGQPAQYKWRAKRLK